MPTPRTKTTISTQISTSYARHESVRDSAHSNIFVISLSGDLDAIFSANYESCLQHNFYVPSKRKHPHYNDLLPQHLASPVCFRVAALPPFLCEKQRRICEIAIQRLSQLSIIW